MPNPSAVDPETTIESHTFTYDLESFHYAVTHVFLPVQLPSESDYTLERDLSLVRAMCSAAHAYSSEPQWNHITKMLDNLQASVQSEQLDRDLFISQLGEMQPGDMLAFFIRHYNSAILLTKQENCMLLESFEASPPDDSVRDSPGPLICSYPSTSVEIPNIIFDDMHLRFKFADLLCHPPTRHPSRSSTVSAHVKFTTLLSTALQDAGRVANVSQVVKRIRDDYLVRRDTSFAPWRRSSLWLLLRVVTQISLDRSPLGRASYKSFLLFFMCVMAGDTNIGTLSTDLILLIDSKIYGRLRKLGLSTQHWLFQLVSKARTGLQETLDARWMELGSRSCPFRNPSQDELRRDTQLTLKPCQEYVRSAFENHGHERADTSFHPSHRCRGTIDDFLSSSNATFFDEAYAADPDVTLYDIEQSIEQGIDEWSSSVTNAIEACGQLEILMDRYMWGRFNQLKRYLHPEIGSTMLLTGIELFIALDQLALQEIPMLADYSPEIPLAFLEMLLLRRKISLHRLSRAYQYLSTRHSISRPGWSLLSDAFTEDSFCVRYYDQSLDLQHLKVRIDHDRTLTSGGSKSPLPTSLLLSKVVIFELQCPPCVRIWRSAVARIWYYFWNFDHVFGGTASEEEDLLSNTSGLRHYFQSNRDGPSLAVEIHFAYFRPQVLQTQNSLLLLRYTVRYPRPLKRDPRLYYFAAWRLANPDLYNPLESFQPFLLYHQPAGLGRYINFTFHTPNDTIVTLTDCPKDFSPDEFAVFLQLRSGGSLQWLNILQGLQSGTLNLHNDSVYSLLACAALQVGPLDLDTGLWIWHQPLQEPSFCIAFLDALETLLIELGLGLTDHGTMMRTISLLLSRVLASSASEAISKRAIALLRMVRRRTFRWMQDLSYDLSLAPTNHKRRNLLLGMARVCQDTFNADSVKHFHSAEDADAALSSSLFVHVLRKDHEKYPSDLQIALTLGSSLGNVVVADVSDYAIDLAVCKIYPGHKPNLYRWNRLEHPNDRWLTCQTREVAHGPSRTLYFDLISGALRMDGQPLGGISHFSKYENGHVYERIFSNQSFLTVPSNLPGMDFMTQGRAPERQVHFRDTGTHLVVRVRCNWTRNILELVPPRVLENDLPPVLLKSHVYWLNLATRKIEIRPLERLWEESSENWTIDCASESHCHGYKGTESLLDIHSPTWTMVSKGFHRFSNFDYVDPHWNAEPWQKESNNILISALHNESPSISTPAWQQLSVALPRYGLSFFANDEGELESRDFKHMVYDENQCIGTLFGLENLLVLQQKARLPQKLIHRRILVPTASGFGITQKSYHQVQVTYQSDDFKYMLGALKRPFYHTYSADVELGHLVGNGSLESTLYLANLHANTSYDRPDPLTGEMGRHAAFGLLQSAQCRPKLIGADISLVFRYPQIDDLFSEIKRRYHWNSSTTSLYTLRLDEAAARKQRIKQRGAYLLTWQRHDTTIDTTYPQKTHNRRMIPLQQLFLDRPPPKLQPRTMLPRESRKRTPAGDTAMLDQVLHLLPVDISASAPSFQREYMSILEKSAQRVREESSTAYIYELQGQDHIKTLEDYFAQCRLRYLDALDKLAKCLGPIDDPRQQIPDRFDQWLPITANVLLRCMNTAISPAANLPKQWKKCLISIALLLLDLQRARRLLLFALEDLKEEFSKELENEPCDGWSPEEYPDWLLIQVQGNFLVRRSQAETAMEVMSPRSGKNTVMQVNMGEGKSSVIIPIVATALADGHQVVRIIVPKAQISQMFELLVSRLSGVAYRPVYYLSFSRSLKYGQNGKVISLQIDDLHSLMSQCMEEHGILLMQPETVASLKLMAMEKQLSQGNPRSLTLRKPVHSNISMTLPLSLLWKDGLVGKVFQSLSRSLNHRLRRNVYNDLKDSHKWLNLQKWIQSHARDVLDESDEILRPRFQLIYTIGLQHHVHGHPHRWVIIQQVLELVKSCADALSKNHPGCIEYACGPQGSFPQVRIARSSDIGRRLIPMIVESVMDGGLLSVDMRDASDPGLQRAIRSFISDPGAIHVPDTVKSVEDYAKCPDKSHMWNGLLLLRGLLASNILFLALVERRWRVDYGLVLSSQYYEDSDVAPPTILLAVPYQAKDLPSPTTQFGHPDITIIFTCLSYYYGGLTEDQLRTSFEILLGEAHPTEDYALWVKDYDASVLRDSLRILGNVNLRPSEQWDKVVFPLFSRNKAAIDFYLSRVVFPREAKEFPWKLSASSWDLAETREKLTTGFSGTSDIRWLLPMSIAQRDMEHQRGTNARALAYLLHDQNDSYTVIDQSGGRQMTPKFLQMLASQEPKTRVLLDVGAQILDLSNFQVAKAWLEVVRDVAGAVYFDKSDRLTILMQNGTCIPMLSSSLSQQLNRCVVYLDHAHTRGTDLKLPIGSRAAVTLGPKLTKDSLVQGCMRMRKLGRGHSVMFFAPPEVDWSIRAVTGKKDPNTRVNTADILCWAIHETWADIQKHAPYWAQQGMSHKSRNDAWSRFCNDELTAEQLAEALLQQDQKSLEDLYAPGSEVQNTSALADMDPGIRQRCKDLGVLSLPSAQMDEEQEREVNREREREREVELPPKAEPAEHFLHLDVTKFVKTGIIPPSHLGSAFLPVFTSLKNSSAVDLEADVWTPFILATTDFCATIKPESTKGTMDQYLRPVQWVLTSRRARELVLISPFEANRLLPDIRASECVHLHLYAPRTLQRMKPSDDLKLYSTPPLPSDWTPPWELIDQLNLFAGQLYLRDYQTYLRVCQFLDIPTHESPMDGEIPKNKFDIPGSLEQDEITFSSSSLPSVMALLAIRTRGRPFGHTHMGKIIQGKTLTEKDFAEPGTVASDHIATVYDEAPSDAFRSENSARSPSNMECDPQHTPESSPSVLKRKLDAPGTDPEPPQKRLRSD